MADQQAQTAAAEDAPAPGLGTASVAPATILQDLEPLPEDGGDLEAEHDSAYASSVQSGWTSLRPSILAGLIENGRRYQVQRANNDINIPSDEKQFESMNAGHLAYIVVESLQENPYFRAPISEKAQHIIDIGTGEGSWAISVADRFPNVTVHGVDLYPPPQKWVPPNCIFEVDDVTKAWTWNHQFDFVHIRMMNGSLPHAEWERLYKRAYNNLAPGGWIEHTDCGVFLQCDDSSMPKDSYLANHGAVAEPIVAQTGFNMKVPDLMRAGIENAGFINVHERDFKMPLGEWPKHPIYKEAGRLNRTNFKQGLEGWLMYAFTRFGLPQPWTAEEVAVYVAKLRQELDRNYHIYQPCKKVWAQKPFDAPNAEQKPTVENVEA